MKRLGTLMLVAGALVVLGQAQRVHAQNPDDRNAVIDRSNRLRAHEQRIKEMIEIRRREAQERERQEQEMRATEAAEKGEPVELVAEAPPPTDSARAASSVVMGFRFVDEEGHGAYNIIAEEGQTFMSEVTLFNMDKNPVNRVRLALDYDRRFIEPLQIFDTEIRPLVDGEPQFSVTDREQFIIYNAEFAKPLDKEESVLLRILWRATRRTPYTGIMFAFDELEEDEKSHTAIYSGDRNILGLPDDPADGVISGGLMVSPPSEDEPVLQGKGEELRTMYLGSVASQDPVGIHLVPPANPPQVGEEFVVRVLLNNPHSALIDAFDLCVRFDPEVFQVVDMDQFNYMRRGVNIHDGPYTEFFPWDMHKRNDVRNDVGTIVYQKALGDGAALPSRTVANIHFRAIAPTDSTRIHIQKGRMAQLTRTSVRYFGFERLDLGPEMSTPSIVTPVLPAPRMVADQAPPAQQSEAVAAEEIVVRTLKIQRD